MHKWGSSTNGPQGIWGNRGYRCQHILVPGTNEPFEALGHIRVAYMGFSTFGVPVLGLAQIGLGGKILNFEKLKCLMIMNH